MAPTLLKVRSIWTRANVTYIRAHVRMHVCTRMCMHVCARVYNAHCTYMCKYTASASRLCVCPFPRDSGIGVILKTRGFVHVCACRTTHVVQRVSYNACRTTRVVQRMSYDARRTSYACVSTHVRAYVHTCPRVYRASISHI